MRVCVRVYVSVRACIRERARARMCVCVCVSVCVCVCVFFLTSSSRSCSSSSSVTGLCVEVQLVVFAVANPAVGCTSGGVYVPCIHSHAR